MNATTRTVTSELENELDAGLADLIASMGGGPTGPKGEPGVASDAGKPASVLNLRPSTQPTSPPAEAAAVPMDLAAFLQSTDRMFEKHSRVMIKAESEFQAKRAAVLADFEQRRVQLVNDFTVRLASLQLDRDNAVRDLDREHQRKSAEANRIAAALSAVLDA